MPTRTVPPCISVSHCNLPLLSPRNTTSLALGVPSQYVFSYSYTTHFITYPTVCFFLPKNFFFPIFALNLLWGCVGCIGWRVLLPIFPQGFGFSYQAADTTRLEWDIVIRTQQRSLSNPLYCP